MKNIDKVSAIFGIVSAVSMAILWAIIVSRGLLQTDMAVHPAEYGFLLATESITCVLSFIGGLGLLRGKAPGFFYLSMGMLVYAVISGTGKFLDRGMFALGFFLMAVAIATGIVIMLNLRVRRTEEA